MAIEQSVHRISTAEYERMVDSGALEDMRVELLDGLLVDMSPQGEVHARVIQRVMRLCAARMDLLRVQMPLSVAEGWMPEPDVALAELDADPTRRPSTALLVVEVAVSSQAVDRRKARAYARAGVPRFWLVDLPAGVVLAHTEPTEDGYAAVARLVDADIIDARVDGVEATTVAELLTL
jgi:Uma2 family endonuclease